MNSEQPETVITAEFATASKQTERQWAALCRACFLSSLLLAPALTLGADKVFYRYTNDKGVRVLHHSIPPEYAQKGYEVVSLSGKVIKTVPPALSKDEVAKLEAEKRNQEAMARWDNQLKRRYSRAIDIEAAKTRKLSDLEANIAILRSNISSLNLQIQEQQSKAANFERGGREVPANILKAIDNLELELEDTEELVRLRLMELNEVAAKYDRDIERFKEISGK